MSETLDIVATTNPAYCSLVMATFVDTYVSVAKQEPHFCLSFIALPIAMSSTINRTFSGTNARTGLITWISRNPELELQLPCLLRSAVPVVRKALLFGLQTSLLQVTAGGGLRRRTDVIGKLPRDPTSVDIGRKHHGAARSLGIWCGGVRSPSTIFTAIGVTP